LIKKGKNPHTELKKDVILEVAKSGMARVWPQETGTAYSIGSVKAGVAALKTGLSIMDIFKYLKMISYGRKGSADISGIMVLDGRRLEIEIKTGTGRQEEDQKSFALMIEKHGGIYILARSVEQALADLKKSKQHKHGAFYGT